MTGATELPQTREGAGLCADAGGHVHDIRFDGVGFGDDPERPVLRDVSFTAEQGQVGGNIDPEPGLERRHVSHPARSGPGYPGGLATCEARLAYMGAPSPKGLDERHRGHPRRLR